MKKENENKKQTVQTPEYEAPVLTTVSFKTERGYASSLTSALTLGLLAEATRGDQSIESRTTGDSWGSDW